MNIENICWEIHFLLNFEVFRQFSWVVEKNDLELLSFGELSIFLKRARKMGIPPSNPKFDVDIFTSKVEQNRPTGT